MKLLLLALLQIGLYGATTQVSCSSASTVQTAITNAASGDTVQCNATGSYSWGGGVTLPATKNITLDLNGSTITAGTITINSGATYHARLTNGACNHTSCINTDDGFTNAPWRIDHMTFTGSGTLGDLGNGPGLIDHCNIGTSGSKLAVAQETFHLWGFSGDAGWTNADSPGAVSAIYFEDNTVIGTQGNSTCLFQGYYGSRVVARYNNLNGAMLEQHGTAGNVGARWWEFYRNTFSNAAMMCLRAGSGVIFGNTGEDGIIMVEEDSGYPASYQIGRGRNQALYPAYAFLNSSGNPDLNVTGCAPPAANMVQLNRDVYVATSGTLAARPATCSVAQAYWATDQGSWNTSGSGGQGVLYKCTSTDTWTSYYTPYTYPHPLQGVKSGTGGSTIGGSTAISGKATIQ